MARKLIVEVIADSTKFLQSMKASSTATTQFAATVDKAAVSSGVAAKAQVAAAVKTTESLQLQVAEYKRLAVAAELGSREQIAAANLAAQAEKRLAASMGVAAHEAGNLQRHSGLLGRDVSKATRGALSGSGAFHTFGRSLAFASGGFLAFEGVTSFLTESIKAAREAGVANRSLAAQMRASGESFRANREQIEKVSLSYGKFGFQNDEVVASLTILERGTGKINEALKLQGLTADIARAKNIQLSAAANIVAKVFGHQETALRRAVPGLHKNAHGWDLISEAMQKMSGQAAAGTTASERFSATLHDTQEIIGKGLLPILNQYLDTLSKWMGDTRNQAKLQRDVNAAARGGGKAFGTLATAIGLAADAVDKYNTAVSHLPGGKKGQLQTAVNIVSKGNIFEIVKFLSQQVTQLQKDLHLPGVKPGPTGFAGPQGTAPGERPSRFPPPPSAATLAGRAATSLRGRFNIQELKLAQAQLTARLDDDRKILVVEEAIVRQQIKQSKTLKDRTGFTNTLAGIVGQVRNIDQQSADALKAQAQARKDAAKAAADAAKEAKRLAKERQATRLQTGLDWLDFGLEKAQATPGIKDNIAAEKKIIAGLKEMARLTGMTVDTARLIWEHRQALKDLQKQKGAAAKKDPDNFGIAGAIIGTTHLPAGVSRRTLAPPPALQLPGERSFTINGGLHIHGVQNVAQLEQELQKRSKQRQQPRRGAH